MKTIPGNRSVRRPQKLAEDTGSPSERWFRDFQDSLGNMNQKEVNEALLGVIAALFTPQTILFQNQLETAKMAFDATNQELNEQYNMLSAENIRLRSKATLYYNYLTTLVDMLLDDIKTFHKRFDVSGPREVIEDNQFKSLNAAIGGGWFPSYETALKIAEFLKAETPPKETERK